MFSFPVKRDEPLAPYTWFKLGGPAQYLVVVDTLADFRRAITEAIALPIPLTIIGGGSNLLISDHGLSGLVIINRVIGIQVSAAPLRQLEVASGTPMNMVVNEANRRGLAGLAGFLGIPGTIGGAIYNNSHYHTQLIGDFVTSVDILDAQGEPRTLGHAELKFAYDHSRFQTKRETILRILLTLNQADPGLLIDTAKASLRERRLTQPLDLPSSGCMFKNLSAGDVNRLGLSTNSAGSLIDHLGLKGLAVGDAVISNLHANFIVNQGHATTRDVYQLSELIKQKVWAKYQIDLEREVFLLGDFTE